MPICRHCHKEFETDPAHSMGKRKYCYKLDCIRKEKERAKAVKKAWYEKVKKQGYFKAKQRDRKGIKPVEVEKTCLHCHQKYMGILGLGDTQKWGMCPECKQLATGHLNEDDFGIEIPGLEFE